MAKQAESSGQEAHGDKEISQPTQEQPKSKRAAKKKSAEFTSRAKKKSTTSRKTEKEALKAVKVSADQLPRRSIEQSLRVARALRDALAGGPATWEDIASAMELGSSQQNRYYLWSAQAYSLVQRNETFYTLSETGRKILAPTSAQEAQEAIVQAVLTPVVFSRFFTDYNGSPFPSKQHIGNILERRYSVPRERLTEAETLIRENGIYARILEQQTDGTMLVKLDPRTTGLPQPSAVNPESLPSNPVDSSNAARKADLDFGHMCFVITPVGDEDSEQRRHANMVLKSIIEPVAAELGLRALRADQIERAGLITQQIFECLAKARVCVSDLSFNNPNAFYELGIRHMCKLPTVQIIRKGDKIPFDVSQGRTIRIDMSDVYSVIDSVESARKELKQQLSYSLSGDYKGDDNPINTYLPGLEIKLPR